ncbi:hypothetical protein EPJ66_08755 [Brachyspira aalborgi]|uniref:hypothetical protein n=1 Tax=Brachyspira aalborgi TaxID=29522 RepID=UPI0011C94E49|nr:hypothetical protein [Brachyspira aalborgi]TXJ50779.1 hypothetical protein EPJ66_08755 [Brachyspira aalborgi]
MTKVLKFLVSGLSIFLLASSLYAINYQNWYDNYYSQKEGSLSFLAFAKEGQTNKDKALFSFDAKLEAHSSNTIITITIPEKVKLKKYSLKLFNGFENTVITNTDNGRILKILITKDYLKDMARNSCLYVYINNKGYSIDYNVLVSPYYGYITKLQRDEAKKEQAEALERILGIPTKEEIEQYQKKVIMSNDLNDRYINIYNNYASEATKMGLNGAFQKDLYFLHRYVKQTTFNPENVYNVMVGDLAIDNIKQNKKILVYVRKNGSPFRVSFNDGEKEHVINSYVFVDFAFNSGGSKQLQESHEKGFLNSMATIPYFYIMSGNKRVYLYRRDSFAYYYILLYDKVIKVSLY